MTTPPFGWTGMGTISDWKRADGDTIEVVIERTARLRIRNCWAPEVNKGRTESREMGRAAAAFMQSLLPPGSKVIIHVPTEDADSPDDLMSWSRVIADVYLPHTGDSVADVMCEANLAWPTKSGMLDAISQRVDK